jgi:uncharacterized protein involved in response to NO
MKWIFSEPHHGTSAYVLLAAGIIWLFLSQLLRSPMAAYLQVIFISGGLGFLFAGIAEVLPKTQTQIAIMIRIGAMGCMLICLIAAICLLFVAS